MSPLEQPIVIQGPVPMFALLAQPPAGAPAARAGVVIVNGGAQYRAGAHRLFVRLARHLAAQGHAVLRFDLPGQGDSPGEPVAFEHTAPHIAAVVDALHQHHPRLERTALLGLCDGASASLLYLRALPDPRITHLALLNPWVHSDIGQARVQIRHYYRQRLLMPDFWHKLLTGRVGWRALGEFGHKLQQARPNRRPAEPAFQDRMAQAWQAFEGPVFLALSEHDQTAQEFAEWANLSPAWRDWQAKPGLTRVPMPSADHTFSVPGTADALNHQILQWLTPRNTA